MRTVRLECWKTCSSSLLWTLKREGTEVKGRFLEEGTALASGCLALRTARGIRLSFRCLVLLLHLRRLRRQLLIDSLLVRHFRLLRCILFHHRFRHAPNSLHKLFFLLDPLLVARIHSGYSVG